MILEVDRGRVCRILAILIRKGRTFLLVSRHILHSLGDFFIVGGRKMIRPRELRLEESYKARQYVFSSQILDCRPYAMSLIPLITYYVHFTLC